MKKRPDPVDINAGARVRARRIQIGKSQEWLAAKLGLTFQQVQKYEKGMNRMGSSRLQQIAGHLNVPVSYFFDQPPGTNTGDVRADDAVREFVSSRDGLAVIAAWRKLRPKVRSAMAALIEAATGD